MDGCHVVYHVAGVNRMCPRDPAELDATNVGGAVTEEHRRLRARQNVVLEYGWFWGRLGRQRALLLMRDKIELPSDIRGLRYETYRNGDDLEPAIRRFVEELRGSLKR